jgi:hypothetical protein
MANRTEIDRVKTILGHQFGGIGGGGRGCGGGGGGGRGRGRGLGGLPDIAMKCRQLQWLCYLTSLSIVFGISRQVFQCCLGLWIAVWLISVM